MIYLRHKLTRYYDSSTILLKVRHLSRFQGYTKWHLGVKRRKKQDRLSRYFLYHSRCYNAPFDIG